MKLLSIIKSNPKTSIAIASATTLVGIGFAVKMARRDNSLEAIEARADKKKAAIDDSADKAVAKSIAKEQAAVAKAKEAEAKAKAKAKLETVKS